MNQSSLHLDDQDQDSLFGSPPPSPARGRSPPRETSVAGEKIRPTFAFPSAGVGRKNVGTIALPGSHMSCAELPANLPASSFSLPRPTSSHDLLSGAPRSTGGTPAPVHVMSQASTCPIPSRASSTASIIPSASALSRRRRTPKSKSSTPVSPTPPITLPGPDEPTPPNFLRSQSSLLGLAGLVGCVKPAQLYTNASQPTHVRQSRSHSPTHGLTPAHPIVLDDDQHISRIGKHPCGQLGVPQHPDRLDPGILRSNIVSSLAKEKNIFPVLESLIKLLGGEPHLPPANHPPQPFARPYGHGIFNVQPSPPVVSLSSPSVASATLVAPPKRRKLKHVPAGATDWDVPYPFAAGEGPKTYHNTWARDRARQLVTQLLELVQSAAQRAAVKTAKSERSSRGQTRARSSRSSRSASVEAQTGQIDLSQANAHELPLQTYPNTEPAMLGMPIDSQDHHSDSLEIPSTIGSPASAFKDRTSVDPEGVIEEGCLAVSCDHSAFEEWLYQLQQPAPFETGVHPLESDRSTRLSAHLDPSASSQALDIHMPMPQATPDEAIDPTLLAMSRQFQSAYQVQSPTSAASTVVPDFSPTLPALAHSPRTLLSSLTEPLTPHCEAFADVLTSTIAHQHPARDPAIHYHAEKDCFSPAQAVARSSSPTEASSPPRASAAQKGKERASDGNVTSSTPSTLSRSTPSGTSASKGTLDKRTVLERARERRKQLVAEIERAKIELWGTTIEHAVLVHFTRDGSS